MAAVKGAIPTTAVHYLLVAQGVVIAPHLWRMPWWISVIAVLLLLWRLQIQRAALRFPGRVSRTLLVLVMVPLVFASHGFTGASVEISVALLLLGVILKQLEMRNRRDFVLICSLTFLLLATQFIFSQSLLDAAYGIAGALALTMALNAAISDHRDTTHGERIGLSARLLVYSLPLMLVLFVFVPRIGPLWTMPVPGDGATTGISDQMTPGDITALGRSDELAFRVGFENGAPPPGEWYWRGLVLDNFEEGTWRRSRSRIRDRAPGGPAIASGSGSGRRGYHVIMEPSGQDWLYSLAPSRVAYGSLRQDGNYTLYSPRRVTHRMRYAMEAAPGAEMRANGPGSDAYRRALRLPDQGNEQSRDLARRLQEETENTEAYVRAVLARYTRQPFYYTLSPAALDSSDSIDEFLFQTREGFCGHYAGSFVFLMRAAGIPARVVAGYQGAEPNPYEEYLMVYQYNAHAWAEIWVPEQGWTRVDPTAAVAPDRIESGMEAWMESSGESLDGSGERMMGFRNNPWINALRLRMDSIDYAWNRWVINYDSESQMNFLEQLTGLRSITGLAVSLLAAFTAALTLVAAALLYGLRVKRTQDPALRSYRRFLRFAETNGVRRRPGEGAVSFADRFRGQRPELAESIDGITETFVALYYGSDHVDERRYRQLLERLDSQLRALRQGERLANRRQARTDS